MAAAPLSFMESLTGREPGVLPLRGEPVPRLLVWEPELITALFRADREMLHPGSRTLRPVLGAKSLIWLDGPRHTAYRAALSPRLHGNQLRSSVDAIARIAEQEIGELLPGKVIQLPVWTRRLTLRIFSRIMLGAIHDELLTAFTTWIEHELGSRGRTMAHRYFGDGSPRPDLRLDEMLLQAAKAAPESALASALSDVEGIDEAERRDQLITLLFAGHETTASAIAWTLYWLHSDQDLLTGVLDEIDGTEGFDDLPLLDACAHEALRLSPPATLAGNRMPSQDTELAARPIRAGTVLTPAVYLAHRHPAHFPEPRRFRPERFLERRVPASQYFPFGGGSRHCLGRELALLEIRMITGILLRRARLRFLNPRAGRPQLRGAAMAPNHRLQVDVRVKTR